MRIKYIMTGFIILILLIFTSGCTNTEESSEQHFEAIGLYIVADQDTIVKYVHGLVEGKIEAKVSLNTAPLSILFIKNDGSLGLPPNESYGLDWQVGDTTIAKVLAEEDILNYIIYVRGIRQGQTPVAFILKYRDQKIFESGIIPVQVEEVVILPKQ